MEQIKRLLTVTHPNVHIQRRGRLVVLLALVHIGISVLFIPASPFGLMPLVQLVTLGVTILVCATTIYLVHRRLVALSGWMLVGINVLGVFDRLTVERAADMNLFLLIVPVLLAGLVLRPAQVWWVFAIDLATTAVPMVGLFGPQLVEPLLMAHIVVGLFLMLLITLMAYLGAQATERAVQTAVDSAQRALVVQTHAEAQAHALEAQAAALTAAEQQQRDLITTLETPTVPLAEGVVLAPLIGSIDGRRAQALTAHLLQMVAAQRVRLLILDIGGVAAVDTLVAQALTRVVQAVQLLGCEVVMTGISAAVATTITDLNADLGGVRIARTPQIVLAEYGAACAS